MVNKAFKSTHPLDYLLITFNLLSSRAEHTSSTLTTLTSPPVANLAQHCPFHIAQSLVRQRKADSWDYSYFLFSRILPSSFFGRLFSPLILIYSILPLPRPHPITHSLTLPLLLHAVPNYNYHITLRSRLFLISLDSYLATTLPVASPLSSKLSRLSLSTRPSCGCTRGRPSPSSVRSHRRPLSQPPTNFIFLTSRRSVLNTIPMPTW